MQSTYFPGSDGAQKCPGTKYAQVEFVAVLVYILQEHRIRLIQKPGETFDQARGRAFVLMEVCDFGFFSRDAKCGRRSIGLMTLLKGARSNSQGIIGMTERKASIVRIIVMETCIHGTLTADKKEIFKSILNT